jgi:hypothetical protein
VKTISILSLLQSRRGSLSDVGVKRLDARIQFKVGAAGGVTVAEVRRYFDSGIAPADLYSRFALGLGPS